jgi:hypothetical protein
MNETGQAKPTAEYLMFQQDMRDTIVGEPDWDSNKMNLCWALWFKAYQRNNPKTQAKGPLVPHTYGGFRSVFYVEHKRAPTEQEIFDAGMRGGRDIQWPDRHTRRESLLGELLPTGLTEEQKATVLAKNLRFALNVFRRIAQGGVPNVEHYAALTVKHLDPRDQFLFALQVPSKEEIIAMFDEVLSKNPRGLFPTDEPVYMTVQQVELMEFVNELLKKVKV